MKKRLNEHEPHWVSFNQTQRKNYLPQRKPQDMTEATQPETKGEQNVETTGLKE